MKLFLVLTLTCVGTLAPEGRAQPTAKPGFDVIAYDAEIEPDIVNKTVKGKVLIRTTSNIDDLVTVEFDCGALVIDSVRENSEALKFTSNGSRVSIFLSRPAKAKERRTIAIQYHGTPRYGLRFFPDRGQVYTAFSTSQWLVCVDAPEDKATLRLNLVVAKNAHTVANGRFVGHRLFGGKLIEEWRQDTPVPTYTFGFAFGQFHELTERHGGLRLRYLADRFSDEELRRIFGNTKDMIGFYESRAGVRYADRSYTQVLAEQAYGQEMSGFAVMGENYGRRVLANESDVTLIAHELAHQWWGNMVTCRDWTHFWLNEGMATFMAAAYKEHRFGRNEYLREIEASRLNYEKVRNAGKDRSLVFPDWLHRTREDRILVYNKGAYVLHLLRQELGERAFWAGIRHYTRMYFGKTVTTTDFQSAMEQASGKNLSDFFGKWVYLTQR